MPLIFDRNRFFTLFERRVVFFSSFVLLCFGRCRCWSNTLVDLSADTRIETVSFFIIIIIIQFIVCKCISEPVRAIWTENFLHFYLCDFFPLVLLLVYNQLVRWHLSRIRTRKHTHTANLNNKIYSMRIVQSKRLDRLSLHVLCVSIRTNPKKIK